MGCSEHFKVSIRNAATVSPLTFFFSFFFLLVCVCMIPINIQQMASLSGVGQV